MRPYPKLVVLVRHAESVGNTLSVAERARTPMGTNWYALTERGREQARITGEWLRAQYPSPRRIIRSYYQRTRETADLLYPDFPIREDERLAEASRGIWHVRTEDEIRREAPWEIDRKQFEGLYHYRPIGGENWPDVEGPRAGIPAELALPVSGRDGRCSNARPLDNAVAEARPRLDHRGDRRAL